MIDVFKGLSVGSGVETYWSFKYSLQSIGGAWDNDELVRGGGHRGRDIYYGYKRDGSTRLVLESSIKGDEVPVVV